jgi:hypothetical protein
MLTTNPERSQGTKCLASTFAPYYILESDRHVVRGTLRGTPPAFAVDLGRGDVSVAEEILDFADIDGSIWEQGGGRRPQGVGRVNAAPAIGPIRILVLFDGARQPHKVTLDQQIHAHGVHWSVGKLPATG